MGVIVVNVEAEVESCESVVDSSVLLLAGIADALRAALDSDDPLGNVDGIIRELNENARLLAVAVASNTASENDSEEFDASEAEESEGEDEPEELEDAQPDFSAEDDAPVVNNDLPEPESPPEPTQYPAPKSAVETGPAVDKAGEGDGTPSAA